MKYEDFPAEQRYAVRFHSGNRHAPDGWPSEANPIDGNEPPNGYALRTGAELNQLRAKLHTKFIAVCEERRAELATASAIKERDTATASEISDGFDWNGQRFSMSLAAQLNCVHDAEDAVFPVTRSSLDGVVVTLDEAQFEAFRAAMRGTLRACRDAGNLAKSSLTQTSRSKP
jgi:hypothetical protein